MPGSGYSIKILPTKDNGVELVVHPDTPVDVVNKTVSSLINKGLVEVLTKSTATSRVFKVQSQTSVEDEAVSRTLDIFKTLTASNRGLSSAQVPSRPVADNNDNDLIASFADWVAEATKPISQRFKSEKEAIEYWRSIPVSDSVNDIDN